MDQVRTYSQAPKKGVGYKLATDLRVLLFSALSVGCSSQMRVDRTLSHELVSAEDESRRVNNLIESESGEGRVVHIRDWHGTHSESSDESFEGVAMYQMLALEDYLYAKPKAILAEANRYRETSPYLSGECEVQKSGEGIDCKIEQLLSGFSEEELLVLQKIKVSGTSKLLSENESSILTKMVYWHGAAMIYGAIYQGEDIDWLSAESMELNNAYIEARKVAGRAAMQITLAGDEKALRKSVENFNEAWKLVISTNEARESEAAVHLKDYFAKHPDATVFLSYGGIHNFCDNLSGLLKLYEVLYRVPGMPDALVETSYCEQNHTDEQLKPRF